MPTWEDIARGFNAWLEDYIEHPDAFLNMQETVSTAMKEAETGEPTYGANCAGLLEHYIKESS